MYLWVGPATSGNAAPHPTHRTRVMAGSEPGEPDAQVLVADRALVALLALDMLLRVQDDDGADALGALLEHGPKEEPRVGRPEADMGPAAEGHVRVGLAVEAHLAWRLEGRLVLVRRRPAERHPAGGLDGRAVHLGLDRADAADVGERRKGAEELLAGVDDARRVLPQELEGLRVPTEVREDRGDRVDDRVAPPGEGQVGEPHHLLAGQGPPTEGRPCEGAEKVLARARRRAVELGVQVGLEGLPLALAGAAVPEHVGAPADPGPGLALGDVEQVREGARLQRQRDLPDHLDGPPA